MTDLKKKKKTDLGIDLIANVFRGSIQTKHKIIFDIFFIYFLFNHVSFQKNGRGVSLLTLKG